MYVDADDWRDADDNPDFYGLAPGKTVGLRYGGYVTVTGVVKDDASGAVVEVLASYDAGRSASVGKVKGECTMQCSSVCTKAAGVIPARVPCPLADGRLP